MPLRDQITPVAEPPVTPAALRRLLIDAGARPTDLVDAKTGAVFETTAEILKAAVASPTRVYGAFDMVQWGMLVFYGGAIAVGIRAWLYTTLGVPKRTLDQTDVATLDGELVRLNTRLAPTILKSQRSREALIAGTDTKDVSQLATEDSADRATLRQLETRIATLKQGAVRENVTHRTPFGLSPFWYLMCLLGQWDYLRQQDRAGTYSLATRLKPRPDLAVHWRFGNTPAPSDPVQPLAPTGPARTYAATDQCLARLYDGRFHHVFDAHATAHPGYTGAPPRTRTRATPTPKTTYNTAAMNALRVQLLALRKPTFYGGRKLLMNHLFRTDGSPRETVAEVALAIVHRWTWRDLGDVVLAKTIGTRGTRRTSRRTNGTQKTWYTNVLIAGALGGAGGGVLSYVGSRLRTKGHHRGANAFIACCALTAYCTATGIKVSSPLAERMIRSRNHEHYG